MVKRVVKQESVNTEVFEEELNKVLSKGKEKVKSKEN